MMGKEGFNPKGLVSRERDELRSMRGRFKLASSDVHF